MSIIITLGEWDTQVVKRDDFWCPQKGCGASFKRREELLVHMLQEHPEKMRLLDDIWFSVDWDEVKQFNPDYILK